MLIDLFHTTIILRPHRALVGVLHQQAGLVKVYPIFYL